MPIYRLAYALFVVGACAYAGIRGGWPERAGVATCVGGSLLSVVAEMPAFSPYRQAMHGVLVVDVLVALSFLGLGVSSGRFWPIWSLGFTLAGVFGHVARDTVAHVGAARYFHATGLWAYPTMAAMVVGTMLEARRVPTGQR